jgi:ubiquinone/menaquinone biosynthesis C-methylase UbiE
MSLDYFNSSYQTGTDEWSSIPYTDDVLTMLSVVPAGGYILDLGCGRGRLSRDLANQGFKVIGVDLSPSAVQKANNTALDAGITGSARFFVGDATQLDFQTDSFDAVVEIGLLQHFDKETRKQVLAEIARVLRNGGHFLSGALSRETKRFLDFVPPMSSDGEFSRFGLHYHFFTNNEMISELTPFFDVESQIIAKFKTKAYGADELDFLFTLCQDSNPRNTSISPLEAVFMG